MHRKLICFWIFICSLIFTIPALADISECRLNDETGYEMIIDDLAGIVDEDSPLVDSIWEQLYVISQYGHAVILTVSENSVSASELAEDTYHDWYDSQSGVLCLIDMENREIYIFSDGKIYATITRSTALTITDNSYAYATKGEYEQCLLEMTGEIALKLEGGHIAQPMRYLSAFFLAILMGLLLTYILAKFTNSTSLSAEMDIMNSISVQRELKDARRLLVERKISKKSSDSGGGSGGGGGGSGSSGGGGGHGF